ncbi:MAG: dihydrolipoyl dehydrogenase [Deltaproteobacteria bacterium]|nr:dihydrolipoyl dehydrogenase [Deltaproteobacteria bacterium]
MTSESSTADVVVIGGGPGGYAAAFRAADLGKSVTLIDADPRLGGVCVNRGCIPSKALLHQAAVIQGVREAAQHGVTFGAPTIDLERIRAWKDEIVTKLGNGVGDHAKRRKVRYLRARGRFVSSSEVEVTPLPGDESLAAQRVRFGHAIVATGSLPICPRLFAIGDVRVMDSTGALELPDVPARLLVVGGGYIGLELGSVYAALGSQVSVVEKLDGLLPGVDRDLVRVLEKRVKEQLAAIELSTEVTALEPRADGVAVTLRRAGGGEDQRLFDRVLVAVGRRPNTEGLGLEVTGVTLDERGFITVDAQRRSADPRIFAIGDVAGEPMLAHKAAHEAKVAAEAIAGHSAAFEPRAIPAVVFTDPEIAWCGLTESEAKRSGRTIEVLRMPWGGWGRALTLGRPDGATKLIVDPETEQVLGMGVVGAGAGELIAEGCLASEMGALVRDVAETIHPHPTLSETISEVAESFFGNATHFVRPRKERTPKA